MGLLDQIAGAPGQQTGGHPAAWVDHLTPNGNVENDLAQQGLALLQGKLATR